MYRYRQTSGSTRLALIAFKKHHRKIGDVVRIKGYCYKGKNANQTAVLIVGTTGTMRLSGLSWGYSGEGVRGLKQILEKLNMPADQMAKILAIKWDGWDKVKEFWSYTFDQSTLAKVA
jgi:hypothetical protein